MLTVYHSNMFTPQVGRVWRAPVVLEIFALGNLSFLGVDILLAHAINAFHHPAEWIPLFVSVLATLLLPPVLLMYFKTDRMVWRRTACFGGLAFAFIAIVTGMSGMWFHLESRFFQQGTLHSLVYTAPFIAPLAYTGVGFLLLLNRMVTDNSTLWARWVVFLALAGFAGNFALSLADHAQNGFFHVSEWIPVVGSAFALTFLVWPVLLPAPNRLLMGMVALIVLAQMVIGVYGAVLHITANFAEPGGFPDNFIYGAPVFAPLLFANLAILTLIGLDRMHVIYFEQTQVK